MQLPNSPNRVTNTHGALYAGTPLQQFARLRVFANGETVIQIYQYGAWVEICPGNEAAFRPMRIIPSYPNHEKDKTQPAQALAPSQAAN